MPVRSPAEARPAAPKAPETALARTRRARRILRILTQTHPDAHCELDFSNPLELLVATILSAQTTDVRVNMVTPALFSTFRTAHDYACADREKLEQMIVSTGFFRAKASSLIGLGQALVERFDGEVPSTIADLVSLPGVGRKTANVVLANAFEVPAIAVDTHVGRLSRRFGWTSEVDPDKVEIALASLFERREWLTLSHRLIFHGRRVCHSRRPACGACSVARLCPSYGEGEVDPAKARALVKMAPSGPTQS